MNVAAKHGFYFHHAHRQDNYVLMCLWTDPIVADRMPAYADHYVGVGGIMVNDKQEVLMIQETRSVGKGADKPWKFPGGYVDRGETVRKAVEREVLEETGVKGEFQGILALREQLDYKYGAADFYMVCVLRPHATEQSVDVQDTQEVCSARWIPLTEITTNEDGCKFKLFPNAFEFLSLVKQWLMMAGKLSPGAAAGHQGNEMHPQLASSADLTKMSVTDVMKLQTLAHRTQPGYDSRAGRSRTWNFYMPHGIDPAVSSSKL